MAQVNVDLSEYDMLRESKTKAEAEVKELRKEVEQLKNTAANVVVRNRYFIPALDYKAAARKLIETMGIAGVSNLARLVEEGNYTRDPFGRVSVGSNVISQLSTIIEQSIKGFLDLKAGYIEDSITTEVRGFDEFATQIREKFELEYKEVMEIKKAQLEREIESYNTKSLDVNKAVKEATDALNEKHEAKIKKLQDNIKELEEQLKEASKSSEEKLAEAMVKLKAAEEEVAKYTTPRKKLFGIFNL